MSARKWRGGNLKGHRALIEWALVVALSAIIVVWLSLGSLADRANFLIYDSLISATPTLPNDDIIIIAIDDRSLEQLGRWPWPRSHHAQLIERLNSYKPRAVAYDVLFLDPEASDSELAQAISRAGNIYLPVLLDVPGPNGAPWQLQEPSGDLASAAKGMGHINLSIDSDGSVRRLPLFLQAGQAVWPQLVVPLARLARPDLHLTAPPSVGKAELLALDTEAIAYSGGPASFRILSFVDVLTGEVPADFITDKLVLVGATAPGLGDRYATPAASEGDLMRGVEIQASLLQTLLEGGGPRDLPKLLGLALSLGALLILLVGFLYLRPLYNMWMGLVLMLLLVALSTGLLLGAKLWFPPTAALAGLALAYPLWSWRRLATASAYMHSEIKIFEQEGLSPHTGSLALTSDVLGPSGGDIVARQVETLGAALKRLRDLDGFINDAIRSLPDATLVTDEKGRILLSNDQAMQLFGKKVAHGAQIAALFQSLGEPAWRRLLDSDTSDTGDLSGPEGKVLRPAAAQLTDSGGASTGLIIRFADMTLIRAVERQREQALQLLTHDMRAPQVSILTLLDGPAVNRDPAMDQRIASYARQTLDLAENYVQLARAETQAYRAEVHDLLQVLMDAADTLWPQANARGMTIHLPDIEDEALIRGDAALLRRMLINLLDNGLKYGPAGTDLTCSLDQRASDKGPLWQLRIRDRGPGLSPEAAERLFQAFGHGGTEHGGVGLGLAFVRTVAERHGGSIHYEAADPGAVFVLTLPLITVED